MPRLNYLCLSSAMTVIVMACVPAERGGETETVSQATPAIPPSDTNPYTAAGTEPFWSVKIDDQRIIFDPMDGPTTSTETFYARPSLNGWRYTSDTISVDVTFSPCSDGMSDVVHKDTVTVLVDTAEYRGCGGGHLSSVSLANTRWEFVELNSRPVAQEPGMDDRRRPGIVFGRTSVGVSGGCNGGGGLYVSGDGWLQSGPVMATEMGCSAAIMAQESAAFSLIGDAKWSIDGEGYLNLTSSSTTARLRRVSYDHAEQGTVFDPKWEARRWNVASLNSAHYEFNAYGATTYTVSFADGRFSGKVGCNRLTANYSIDGDTLVVGAMTSTRMACSSDLMVRDHEFIQLMESRPKFAMSPNRELLIGSDKGSIVLQGSRTADEPEK